MWVDTGIASLVNGLDYRMEGRGIVLDFAAETRDFPSLQRVQTGSCLVGNGVSFPGNKVAGA